ncbi:predicted protein [Plenodomus lingam JN3]|uniref:Predicted protein n=1 Tax=Leptosphaeria maculans (strain JN3 / isolate v23.1.3 / race Av1-4-5-6-7-8) TaxID=985895 RepID=E4ZQV7_LEPMJ|nr:predicted protein [Plenodomus lingam JN3]CBX94112.1 predicted protein [Plenodomus lingam JN3]
MFSCAPKEVVRLACNDIQKTSTKTHLLESNQQHHIRSTLLWRMNVGGNLERVLQRSGGEMPSFSLRGHVKSRGRTYGTMTANIETFQNHVPNGAAFRWNRVQQLTCIVTLDIDASAACSGTTTLMGLTSRTTMSTFRKHTSRPVRLIILLIVTYAFCWVKGWPKYYDDEELPPSQRLRSEIYGGPHGVGHDHLIVSLTATAVDVYAKFAPTIIFTAEEDHGQLLLFSDLQMEIGKWPVFDVLWRYPQDFIMEAKELGRYRAQVDHARKSIPVEQLKKQDEKEEKDIQNMLEKYRLLQTMAAAWEYRPDRSWYIFGGDETWINRANLRDWLSQYDPKSMHFFSNPPNVELPEPFAAGGTAIILSEKVMHELFSKDSKRHKDLIKRWQGRIVDHWSAFDLIFNLLKEELKVELESAWPIISGFDPTNIPWSSAIWCEPVAILHHITPDMASDLWKLEKERSENHLSSAPLRMADLWLRFMLPENLDHPRKYWDNLSSESSNSRWNILFEGDKPDSGRAKSGEESPEACAKACDENEFCVQWSYSSLPQPNWNANPPTKCHLSSSMRYGSYKPPQELNNEGEQSKLIWMTSMQSATSAVVFFIGFFASPLAIQRNSFIVNSRPRFHFSLGASQSPDISGSTPPKTESPDDLPPATKETISTASASPLPGHTTEMFNFQSQATSPSSTLYTTCSLRDDSGTITAPQRVTRSICEQAANRL